MKTINDYILEKFKISSKTISNQKEFKVIDGKNNIYSKEEMNKIIDFADDLEIIPESVQFSYNTTLIKFYRSSKIKAGWHIHNFIKIVNDSKGQDKKSFKVAFCAIDKKSYFWYPSFDLENGGFTLEECFDCIKDKWKEINFSKSIKKYL